MSELNTTKVKKIKVLLPILNDMGEVTGYIERYIYEKPPLECENAIIQIGG